MKNLLLAAAALLVGLCSWASADSLVFQPNPSDLGDLDHHSLYTWRVGGINLGQSTVTGATLSISSIRNWDSNPNRLFIHLLDTAVYSGVKSFLDDNTSNSWLTDITDDFANPRWHNGVNAAGQAAPWLVAPGTGDTFLASPSFTTTAVNYSYSFNAAQLALLNAYIGNGGNFALGFDPDCHFWNNGVTLSLQTTPGVLTPEPATFGAIGVAVAAIYARSRRRKTSASAS